MTTPTDPRAAAEEALRLHDSSPEPCSPSCPGCSGLAGWPCPLAEQARVDRQRRRHALTPILARAVIDGQTERDAARAELASLRGAAHSLLGSLGEYVRQSMHANPEWAPGIRAIEAALAGKFAPTSGLTAFEKDELASLRAEVARLSDLKNRLILPGGSESRTAPLTVDGLSKGFDWIARTLATALIDVGETPDPRVDVLVEQAVKAIRRTAPLTEGEARKVWSEAMWQRPEDDTLETVAIRCIVAASNRRAIPPEVRPAYPTTDYLPGYVPSEGCEECGNDPGQLHGETCSTRHTAKPMPGRKAVDVRPNHGPLCKGTRCAGGGIQCEGHMVASLAAQEEADDARPATGSQEPAQADDPADPRNLNRRSPP